VRYPHRAIFSAAEALAIGLITSVVPAESLLDSALAIATSIKQHPPLSVSLTKKGMWLATETPSLAASIELENRQQVLSALTEDQSEAALSFLEKRAPRTPTADSAVRGRPGVPALADPGDTEYLFYDTEYRR
jgi:enoyl-CoA hydratase/carnithine racemase